MPPHLCYREGGAHPADREEGRFPPRHHRSTDCLSSQTSWGGGEWGGHVGELQRSCRNSNPVANILESSNQRDRLSRNVLVNTTLTVPGFENTAAPLKSGLEVGHLPVLFSSEACNEKRFQTVFFKKQTTNKQKNHTQAFASQAHFYPWILLHQGHRILPTFCGTVDSVFCFFFLSFYAIRK